MNSAAMITIGWREWLAMPTLGIVAVRAKVDTGARSSSLHVESLEEFVQDDAPWLRFSVALRRRGGRTISCVAPALDRRPVTDSSGHRVERWFIETEVEIAGQRFSAEINLTNRRNMLFPMLLGRTALAHRFTVDPGASYSCGRRRARVVGVQHGSPD